jgi:hypothetical protein
LHDPVAIDEEAAGHEKEQAGKEDDFVADARGHEKGKLAVFSVQSSANQ